MSSNSAANLTLCRRAAVLLLAVLLLCCTTVYAEQNVPESTTVVASLAADDSSRNGSGIFGAERWSPYMCGMGIGILCWLIFLLADRPLGISTAYAKTAGMLEKRYRPRQVEQKAYYQKFPPEIDWECFLVIGVIVGAFLSAQLSDSFQTDFLPETWITHAGSTLLLRWITAFAGGIIMGIGARWAGGCTSGHGISGTLQLAVSSWVVVTAMFAGGIITAFAIM